MTHSKEPWAAPYRDSGSVYSAAQRLIALCSLEPDTRGAEANTQRIVACVNACAGMSDPAAEIAALRECAEELERCSNYTVMRYQKDIERARAALAKLPKPTVPTA